MSEPFKFLHVRTWEELRALPGFTGEKVPRETLLKGEYLEPYDMAHKTGKGPCGFADCPANHYIGCIIRLPDGSHTSVGKDCGAKYFKADWKYQVKRYEARKKAATGADALIFAKQDAQALLSEKFPKADPAASLALLRAYDTLPREIREELDERARRGRSVVTRRVPTTEAEQEAQRKEGAPINYFKDRDVTTLVGLGSVASPSRSDAMIRNAERSARDLRELVSTSDDTALIREGMRLLRESRSKAEAAIKRTPDFFTQANISALRVLTSTAQLGIKRVSLQHNPLRLRVTRES